MGQEQSTIIDESIPSVSLKDRSLESVAKYINGGKAKKIVVMVGAGISTSAGIPDFRSPRTGLYANLARLNLPYAEAVFDISYFRSNPLPFYALAHELYPGRYRPTISHSFIRLLSDKGLLLKLFDQNIDCLSSVAGVPADLIVEAHGSFAHQSCIDCKCPYPDERMNQAINDRSVPHCEREQCNGLVKPDIVFFGEALPTDFHRNKLLPAEADLCIIMGTSLSVQPFASLPSLCPEGVPRLLINREEVGGIGTRRDDVLLLEDCDEGVGQLAAALGWGEELQRMWDRTMSITRQENSSHDHRPEKYQETWDERVVKLTEEIDLSLKISNGHAEELKAQIMQDLQTQLPDSSKDHVFEDIHTDPQTLKLNRKLSLAKRSGSDSSIMEANHAKNAALEESMPKALHDDTLAELTKDSSAS